MPSENDVTSTDRRTRKRAARTEALLEVAAGIVETEGVDGLTMAALADAADYAPASLYTYFESRSALLAALQQRALQVLGRVAAQGLDRWDTQLTHESDAVTAALARLWAFSDLFLTAPERHPREFQLQQQLLVTPGLEETEDAETVVPAAYAVLAVPAQLLTAAVDVGALVAHDDVDPSAERTLAWVVALNGALLTDRLATGLPVTGRQLGDHLTEALLTGWGAHPARLARARTLAAAWPGPEPTTTTDDQEPTA